MSSTITIEHGHSYEFRDIAKMIASSTTQCVLTLEESHNNKYTLQIGSTQDILKIISENSTLRRIESEQNHTVNDMEASGIMRRDNHFELECNIPTSSYTDEDEDAESSIFNVYNADRKLLSDFLSQNKYIQNINWPTDINNN